MTANMPWFRYYSETPSDNKFLRIARQSQLDKVQVIGVWTILLCLANDSPDRGKLYVTRSLRGCYAVEDIADILCYDIVTVEMLMELFISMEMIHVDDNGAFCITNWDKRQYISDKKDPTAAERMKKSRLLRGRYADVTPMLRPDTDTDTESEKEEEGAFFAPSPASPSAIFSENISAEHLFEQVTGFTAIPGAHREEDLGKLQSILTKHKARAPAYLAPYWQEWLKRRYRKTNTGWLDWAIVGEIPPTKGDPSNDWKQGYSSA